MSALGRAHYLPGDTLSIKTAAQVGAGRNYHGTNVNADFSIVGSFYLRYLGTTVP
jgi:hypothetical protein